MSELGECFRFNLPNSFARDAERLTDFFQCLGLTAVETEAQSDDFLLAFRQFPENLADCIGQHHLGRGVSGAFD